MGDVARLLGGGFMLYLGAEWFVSGASGIALAMRIPKLIVGLTVVAFGTSAPEVIVSVQAAHGGHGGVALGNVVGSNVANLGLILGVAALVRPARVDGLLRRRELPVLLAATAAVAVVLIDGVIVWWEATLLLAMGVGYTLLMIRAARANSVVAEAVVAAEEVAAAAAEAGAPRPRAPWLLMTTGLVGLGLILFGGHVFVEGATAIARSVGMSERTVGLTIVAVGTSLPELATSVIAALRGHSDIAVGNVVGSNIFNVFICLGSAGLVGRLEAPLSTLALDMSVLLLMTGVAAFFLRTARTVTRIEGGILLAGYVVFIAVVLLGSGATPDFLAWAWARHHNPLSWYIRPLFLVPYCVFAHRRQSLGMVATVVALATSMFWFPIPKVVDPRVEQFLAVERDYLLGAWPVWKIGLTLIVPAFFVLLGLAFWRRSLIVGLVIVNVAGVGKIAWSLGFGRESGWSLVPPALVGMLVVNGVLIAWHRRRASKV
jgi:cation:H+ antiporter